MIHFIYHFIVDTELGYNRSSQIKMLMNDEGKPKFPEKKPLAERRKEIEPQHTIEGHVFQKPYIERLKRKHENTCILYNQKYYSHPALES